MKCKGSRVCKSTLRGNLEPHSSPCWDRVCSWTFSSSNHTLPCMNTHFCTGSASPQGKPGLKYRAVLFTETWINETTALLCSLKSKMWPEFLWNLFFFVVCFHVYTILWSFFPFNYMLVVHQGRKKRHMMMFMICSYPSLFTLIGLVMHSNALFYVADF